MSIDVLLLTTDSDPEAVLPALSLLPHEVRPLRPEVSALLEAGPHDIVLVDARTDLVGARSLCRLLDSSGDLLYVGCTVDPERRLAEHRRKPWGDDIAAWQFDEFSDALSAYAAERDAIASESPRRNAMSSSDFFRR